MRGGSQEAVAMVQGNTGRARPGADGGGGSREKEEGSERDV